MKGISVMYTVALQRDFVAQHFLIGGDGGAENQWHSPHYLKGLDIPQGRGMV
jgi:6-pyruvoyltetrahydropterin/6-carboxytetrahydropterin synthase